MKVSFTPEGLEEYQYWGATDRKLWLRINRLLQEITRHPFEGTGKPEPLRYEFAGYWSRRIDEKHRLIYKATEDEIMVAKCRNHYKK
jgi:toxin YoeB